MLLIIHRSVKRCNCKEEQRKSHKLRSVRFHLVVWFSQVNGSHCRRRDLKFTTTMLIFIHSLNGTILASRPTGEAFSQGNSSAVGCCCCEQHVCQAVQHNSWIMDLVFSCQPSHNAPLLWDDKEVWQRVFFLSAEARFHQNLIAHCFDSSTSWYFTV